MRSFPPFSPPPPSHRMWRALPHVFQRRLWGRHRQEHRKLKGWIFVNIFSALKIVSFVCIHLSHMHGLRCFVPRVTSPAQVLNKSVFPISYSAQVCAAPLPASLDPKHLIRITMSSRSVLCRCSEERCTVAFSVFQHRHVRPRALLPLTTFALVIVKPCACWLALCVQE